MYFTNLLPFLAVIASVQPVVVSRAIESGDVATLDERCIGLDQCYDPKAPSDGADIENLVRRGVPRIGTKRPGSDGSDTEMPDPSRPRIGDPHSGPGRAPDQPEVHIGGEGSTSNRDGDDSQDPFTQEEYYAKGKDVKKLFDGIEGRPDTESPDMNKNYQSYDKYDSDSASSSDSNPGTIAGGRYLRDDVFGHADIDQHAGFERYEIVSTGSNKEPVAEGGYSKEGKTIAVTNLGKKNDGNPKDKQIRASELMWQKWKEVAGDKAKELKYVVQEPVVNEGTKKTIERIYNDMEKTGPARHQPIEFTDSKTDPVMNKAFTELAGTTNVKGTFHMVAQHHRELGEARIGKITTLPKENGDPVIIIGLTRRDTDNE